MEELPTQPAVESGFPVFQKWSIYQTVVRENWMRHREISRAIQRHLAARTSPLRVVDAGCGDGQLARMSFADVSLAAYLGIDLSQPALEEARSSTFVEHSWNGCSIEFICDDLRNAVAARLDESVDVLLAGFSLHHLQTEEKQRFLDDATRVLAPGGIFLWADIACQPGQSRQDYLSSLEATIRSAWNALTAEQVEEVVSHILASDYPETAEWMRAAAGQAGLADGEELYRDPHFGVWSFSL